ncbi:TPA: hypothetical protein NJY08_004427 [Salmonella enterica subsp. enterica serovar Typhi str. AG3]|nr:hypothetical protein [Salmonella enterica subsp. enterica serovar Typhi str. AG3]
MNFEIEEMIHRQIILDLTIRTMERDRKQLASFKMQRAFEMWFESKIFELHNELKEVKSKLGKMGAKLQGEKKLDELMTEYTFVIRGTAYQRNYMHIALKNWTEEEVKRILGLEYKTVQSGQNKKPLIE